MSIAETLGQLALFADLTPSQLEAIAHSHEEDVFAAGERVLRRGLSGGNFYVILEGEASVELDGESRAKLARGDFFGEVSALTGEPAEIISTEKVEQMQLPAAFVAGMRSVITPGTTVLVTQASVSPESTGLQTTVMDANDGKD